MSQKSVEMIIGKLLIERVAEVANLRLQKAGLRSDVFRVPPQVPERRSP